MTDDVADCLLVELLRSAEGWGVAKSEFFRAEDRPAVVRAARRHHLSAALAHAIVVRGLAGQVPVDTHDQLRQDVAVAAIGNYWRLRELDALVERFADHGVAVVLLKGAALAATLFRGRPDRRIGDLDLLIRPSDYGRVQQILTGRGYRTFREELSQGFQLRHENAQAFWRDEEHGSQVDVHWHLVGAHAFRERVDIEWFWQRTTTATVGGRMARVLDHDAQLFHLALHYALHHRFDGLNRSYDIALLLASGAAFDWPALAAAADAADLGDAFRMTLDRVSATWGVPVPRDATGPKRTRVRRLADRLRLAAATAPTHGVEIVLQCLSGASVSEKARYLLASFFPSAAFMRERYDVRHAALMPMFYIWRAGVGVCKLTRSTLSTVGWFVRLRSAVRHA